MNEARTFMAHGSKCSLFYVIDMPQKRDCVALSLHTKRGLFAHSHHASDHALLRLEHLLVDQLRQLLHPLLLKNTQASLKHVHESK